MQSLNIVPPAFGYDPHNTHNTHDNRFSPFQVVMVDRFDVINLRRRAENIVEVINLSSHLLHVRNEAINIGVLQDGGGKSSAQFSAIDNCHGNNISNSINNIFILGPSFFLTSTRMRVFSRAFVALD